MTLPLWTREDVAQVALALVVSQDSPEFARGVLALALAMGAAPAANEVRAARELGLARVAAPMPCSTILQGVGGQ